MITPTQLDKTLIMMINSASVLLCCGMLIFSLMTFIDLPSATNAYWGIGTLADVILDHYAPGWL